MRTPPIRRFLLALAPALAFLGLALPALADGLIVIRDFPRTPRPVPVTHPEYTPLEVRYHHVTARVTGRGARSGSS